MFYTINMPPAQLKDLDTVFAKFINGALILIGMISIIMIVVGGINYIGSGGDKGAAKARETITFAIAGLILAVSAWMILNIFGKFIGVDLGNFSVCFTANCS